MLWPAPVSETLLSNGTISVENYGLDLLRSNHVKCFLAFIRCLIWQIHTSSDQKAIYISCHFILLWPKVRLKKMKQVCRWELLGTRDLETYTKMGSEQSRRPTRQERAEPYNLPGFAKLGLKLTVIWEATRSWGEPGMDCEWATEAKFQNLILKTRVKRHLQVSVVECDSVVTACTACISQDPGFQPWSYQKQE